MNVRSLLPIFPALTAAFLASSATSQTLDFPMVLGAQEPATEAPAAELEYVDRHVIFVVDVSGSVQPEERAAIQRGLAEAMLDDSNEAHIEGFSSYAMTVIYFANTAISSDTIFVSSRDDVSAAVNTQLWDLEHDYPIMPPTSVGAATNMVPAMVLTLDHFDNEMVNGFMSLSKSVVVLGDARPDDYYDVGVLVDAITVEHRATFHAVPVDLTSSSPTEGVLYEFYSQTIQTPEGALGFDSSGQAFPVRRGITMPVSESEQIVPVVARALDLTAG